MIDKLASNEHLIRKATPEDAQILLDLIVAHAEYEREDFPVEGKVEAIRNALSTSPQPFESILVESDGAVRGYCNYLVQYDTWAVAPHMLLDALFLQPELRGKGIGMEIMNFIRDEARKAG
jgi:GNAT superfamily N-acetyltransferase